VNQWEDFIGPSPSHLVIATPSRIHAITHEEKTTNHGHELTRARENSRLDKLEFLRELHGKGLLTEEEFREEKQAVLGAL
jgi:hypothetical protein